MKEIRGNNFIGRIVDERPYLGTVRSDSPSLISFEGELFSEDGRLYGDLPLSQFDDRFNGRIHLKGSPRRIANGFVYSFVSRGRILFRDTPLDKLPERCSQCGQEIPES